MKCLKCGAEVNQAEARFCSRCGAPVPSSAAPASQYGGVHAGGSINAGQNVVGGDLRVGGNYDASRRTGLEGEDLARFAQLFSAVYERIDARAREDTDTDQDLLKKTSKTIEDEAAKGNKADESLIRRSLNTLVKLAPDVAELAVNAITNPGAAVASGVKLVAKAFHRGEETPASA